MFLLILGSIFLLDKLPQFTIFGVGEIEYPCARAQYKTWNGLEINFGYGRSLRDGLSAATYRGYLYPLRENYNGQLANDNVKVDFTPCYATVQIGIKSGDGYRAADDSLYPIPKEIKLKGTLVKGSSFGTGNYLEYPINSPGYSYYYFNDYTCLLDETYPIGDILENPNDLLFTVNACIEPGEEPECETVLDCENLYGEGDWICTTDNICEEVKDPSSCLVDSDCAFDEQCSGCECKDICPIGSDYVNGECKSKSYILPLVAAFLLLLVIGMSLLIFRSGKRRK